MFDYYVADGTCFNTQPPEGGWHKFTVELVYWKVSTHSRPKAAEINPAYIIPVKEVSTHSRPKAAGEENITALTQYKFQHTAARRRLGGSSQKNLL